MLWAQGVKENELAAGFPLWTSGQRGGLAGLGRGGRSGWRPLHVQAYVIQEALRVLQEAVHNAIKHSGARNITVALRCTARDIELDVVDDGMGFDLARATTGQGLGLISMRERIRLEGGQLHIESKPGAGATVRAQVPLAGSGLTMRAVG